MKYTLPNQLKRIFYAFSALFAIAFVFSTFFATQSFAIDSVTISANPTHYSDTDPRTKSWFIYTLPAGEKRTDSVTVTNNTTNTVTVKGYAVDSVKASDGGFALANETDPRNGVGSWVKLSMGEFTLSPKERKNISFTISIPSNLAKGDYSGGIVFQETTPKKIDYKGMGINLVSRIGVRIYETVPGNDQLNVVVRDLHYTVSNNYLTFTFTAENKGTVHLTPTGALDVKDIVGRTLAHINLDSLIGTLVPGKPETITVPTQILSPVLGYDTAQVALFYSPTLAASTSAIVLPGMWTMFAIIVIVLLVIAYFIFKKFSPKNKNKENKIKLAVHIKYIVGAILVGIVLFSWLISYLLSTFIGK